MRKGYPSDISQEQFEIIKKDLIAAADKEYSKKHDLYNIFCAIMYMLKEGCSWEAIPHDFTKWEYVRRYYDIWSKPGNGGISPLNKALAKLVRPEHENNDTDSCNINSSIINNNSIKINNNSDNNICVKKSKSSKVHALV